VNYGSHASAHGLGVPILMYHSIATSAAPRFARFVVRPGEFAAQMEHLAAQGYQPVTVLDFARRKFAGDLPARAVALTFDDGYTDFEDAVLPILQRHNFPATLYVPTAYVGRTALWLKDCDEEGRGILSWRALRDLAAAGIEVAAHSHTHPQLDRIPVTVVAGELRRSRQLLEDNLGASVEGCAYPFGYWNRSVRSSVSEAGYSYACAVGELVASADADALTLPRMTVTGGLDLAGFARLLAARPTPGALRSSQAKRVTWAAMRRYLPTVGGDPQAGSSS
jgi:peptidoglycan/xylan/chitin deacetylase (PgdA/CDA1 family)